MSVKRKYNKANIHISGKFVPSNKGKFIVDAEYVRDDRTDESLLESLNQIDESNQDTNRRIDDMFDSGKIKSDLLPSYVDDIIEGYYYNGAFYLDSEHTQEIQGESGKIYSDISVTPAVDYRWGGSAYVVHHAQADWGQSDATAPDYIKNKPTIPDEQIQSDWEQSDNTQKNFIKNKPTIPAAPVQSDWNQSDNTKLDYIKNKPNILSVENVIINSTNRICNLTAQELAVNTLKAIRYGIPHMWFRTSIYTDQNDVRKSVHGVLSDMTNTTSVMYEYSGSIPDNSVIQFEIIGYMSDNVLITYDILQDTLYLSLSQAGGDDPDIYTNVAISITSEIQQYLNYFVALIPQS